MRPLWNRDRAPSEQALYNLARPHAIWIRQQEPAHIPVRQECLNQPIRRHELTPFRVGPSLTPECEYQVAHIQLTKMSIRNSQKNKMHLRISLTSFSVSSFWIHHRVTVRKHILLELFDKPGSIETPDRTLFTARIVSRQFRENQQI